MKEYALPVIKLIAMLLRNQDSKELIFDLPPKVIKNLEKLRQGLEGKAPVRMNALKALYILVSIWTMTWEKSSLVPFPDPTIVALALSMLQKDGSFSHPKYTTVTISKYEYCLRLVMILEISRQKEKKREAGVHTSDTMEAEPLLKWHREKTDSTFNSLRSLQHRATAIAQTSMGLPRVWWTDRNTYTSMLYEGNAITFPDISKLYVELERLAVEAWEVDVLCGLSIRSSYGDLADDLTSTSVGYSFISDPRNPFLQDRDKLLHGILDDMPLRNRFVASFDAVSGEPVWNKLALKAWLHKYARLEGLLLVRGEMLGGSPGRMTELTGMTYRNIPTSSHRNLVAMGKYIAMLVTYYKGSSMTGTEKLIPHAFDAVTSDLIVQDLSIARPFAELAVMICFPDKPDIHKLYRNHLFVRNTELFTTKDVTNLMNMYSTPILGHPIGVQSWRHICMAFKRKLSSRLEDLIKEGQQDSIEALQAGHNRNTEDRIYGLSPEALAGLAEDVLPLYLDASTDWQVLGRAVPGGLGLSYTDARSIYFDRLVSAGAIRNSKSVNQQPLVQTLTTLVDQLAPALTERIASTVIAALLPAVRGMITEALGTVAAAAASPPPPPLQQHTSA